jgi:hypothetical protein
MVIGRLAVLIAISSALAACASTGDCDPLESCDIREHGCQEQVAKTVACLRGSRAVTPRVDVVDADDFIDEQVKAADEEPLTDDLRAHYDALHLLRLMPADVEAGQLAEDEWDDVAAFFDSDTHRVTVLDRGVEMNSAGSVVLLAHELVHAQQSRETDDEFYLPVDDSRDASWAANAIVEGEATLYQDLADVYAYGFEPAELDWKRIFLDFESDSWIYASGERAIYERVDSSFSYAFGGAYLSAAYRKGGSAAVRKAVRDIPASTRELSAGYPRRAERFAIESLDEVAIPMLPESYAYLTSDRAGAYLFESFLVRAEGRLRSLPDLVGTGVTGDSLSTFRADEDQVAVFWRVRFEDEDHAMFIESRLKDLKASWVVKRDDRDLIVAAVSDEALRDEIAGELTWGPAPEPAVDTDTPEVDEPKRAVQIRCAFRRLAGP